MHLARWVPPALYPCHLVAPLLCMAIRSECRKNDDIDDIGRSAGLEAVLLLHTTVPFWLINPVCASCPHAPAMRSRRLCAAPSLPAPWG